MATAYLAGQALGGELWYEYVGAVPGGLEYEIQVDIFVDPASPAGWPEILLSVDGSVDTVPRTGIQFLGGGCIGAIWNFNTTHVFPGPGSYNMSVRYYSREGYIVNIPNSIDVSLGLTATLVIDNAGANNSPIFNAPVTDQYYTWSTLVHDPQVTEPDGDSLNFELVTPLGDDLDGDGDSNPILGYLMPDEIASTPSDYTWVDPSTGVFLWDQPHLMGDHQIAIQCTERRLINGTWTVIGQVTRDMPLCVYQLPTGITDASATEAPLLTSNSSYGLYTIATRFTDLSVLDAAGRTVLQLGPVPGGTIDLSRLTSGTYTVVARDPAGPIRSTRVALIR